MIPRPRARGLEPRTTPTGDSNGPAARSPIDTPRLPALASQARHRLARARLPAACFLKGQRNDRTQHLPGDGVRRPDTREAGDRRQLRRPVERHHHRRHRHVRQRRHPDRQDRRGPLRRARVALGKLRARQERRGRRRRPQDHPRRGGRQAGHLRGAARRRHAQGPGHLPGRQGPPLRRAQGAGAAVVQDLGRRGARSSRSTARR